MFDISEDSYCVNGRNAYAISIESLDCLSEDFFAYDETIFVRRDSLCSKESIVEKIINNDSKIAFLEES